MTLKIIGSEPSKFKLEINCDDDSELKNYINAPNYWCALVEISEMIREIYKHGWPKEAEQGFDHIQYISDKFWKILDERNIDLNDY